MLPLQVKNITSASVTIDSLNIQMSREGSWDITFEFWLSQRNPVTDPDPGVYSELMTFWGWQSGRWPKTPGSDGSATDASLTGKTLMSGGKNYTLWVQRDDWSGSKWRYFQFRTDASSKSFNGKVDVKPLLDYLMSRPGYSSDFWVTRLEVGSEIDDLTTGSVTMKNITFEVNGQTRSPVFKQ